MSFVDGNNSGFYMPVAPAYNGGYGSGMGNCCPNGGYGYGSACGY